LTPAELAELIRNGEDSSLEFKRDDVQNHDLAKELVAFLNLDGGTLLLGVEDDGRVSGTTRDNLDEWVAEICRTKIEPPVIPSLSWARDVEPGKHVLAVRLTIGPNKPYARVHSGRRNYFIRVGSTSREASRDELERMFQASGHLNYGLKPVPGTTIEDLDGRRLRDYFGRVLAGPVPPDGDIDAWQELLRNLDLMTASGGRAWRRSMECCFSGRIRSVSSRSPVSERSATSAPSQTTPRVPTRTSRVRCYRSELRMGRS
jgi:ATP-dependent DNA helicase RecG